MAFGSTVIILSILLGTLLGWHLFLMCHNMTTIEVGFMSSLVCVSFLLNLRGFNFLLVSTGKEYGPCGWQGNLVNATAIRLTWARAEIFTQYGKAIFSVFIDFCIVKL